MSSAISKEYIDQYLITQYSTYNFTPEGGFYYLFTNNTGTNSLKGNMCYLNEVGYGSLLLAKTDNDGTNRKPIGVMYDTGISIGQPTKIVVCGKAQLLLEDGIAVTSGSKLILSTVAGRVKVGASNFDTNSINFVGYALEPQSSGTNVLVLAYVPMK